MQYGSIRSGSAIQSQGQGTSIPCRASAGIEKNTVTDPTTPGTNHMLDEIRSSGFALSECRRI